MRAFVAVKVASSTSWLGPFQSPAASCTCGLVVVPVAATAGAPVAVAATAARRRAGRRRFMTRGTAAARPRHTPSPASRTGLAETTRTSYYLFMTIDGRTRWQQRYDAARKR